MMALAEWRSDEPCPVCGTGLIVLDDGTKLAAECRLCGWSDTWAEGGEGSD